MSDEIASIRQREKFRALLRDRGISLRRMSIDLGLNESYFQQFVAYGRPSFIEGRILQDAVRYLNVEESLLSPAALALQEPAAGGFDMSDYRAAAGRRGNEGLVIVIPCYDLSQEIEGNSDWRDEQYQTRHMALSRQMLHEITDTPPENLVLLKVSSDTMAPTLARGDCALLDCSYTTASKDGIYALFHESHLLIKRIAIDPIRKQVRLSRDNTAYADIREYSLIDIRVAGRVIWAGKRL